MKAWAVAGEPRRAQASHKGAERPTARGRLGQAGDLGGQAGQLRRRGSVTEPGTGEARGPLVSRQASVSRTGGKKVK